jgi:hypothetical protein
MTTSDRQISRNTKRCLRVHEQDFIPVLDPPSRLSGVDGSMHLAATLSLQRVSPIEYRTVLTICTGVPVVTLATRGAPAPALPEPLAGIRSGSQLGPKQVGPIELKCLSSVRGRKRWGSNAHIRYNDSSAIIAEAPPRRLSGRSQRASYQTPRQRKLSHEQESTIRGLALTKSRRELAADFGVNHETVRSTHWSSCQ